MAPKETTNTLKLKMKEVQPHNQPITKVVIVAELRVRDQSLFKVFLSEDVMDFYNAKSPCGITRTSCLWSNWINTRISKSKGWNWGTNPGWSSPSRLRGSLGNDHSVVLPVGGWMIGCETFITTSSRHRPLPPPTWGEEPRRLLYWWDAHPVAGFPHGIFQRSMATW